MLEAKYFYTCEKTDRTDTKIQTEYLFKHSLQLKGKSFSPDRIKMNTCPTFLRVETNT